MDALFDLIIEQAQDDPHEQQDGDDDDQSHEDKEKNLQQRLALTADSQVDIRMHQRKVSGAELMDILASHNHYSPALLAAKSAAQWKELLVDAASTTELRGRTRLATVGIVFTHSGARTSRKNGNSFLSLTIGNLRSGPAVTVLAFGTAYRPLLTQCSPGKVLLLLNPTLLPPGDNNQSTAVTLAVYSAEQCMVVAQAQDYGTCTFACYRPQQRQTRPCGRWVNLQHGLYCNKHRAVGSNGTSSNTGSSSNNNKTGNNKSRVDMLRQKHGQSKQLVAIQKRQHPNSMLRPAQFFDRSSQPSGHPGNVSHSNSFRNDKVPGGRSAYNSFLTPSRGVPGRDRNILRTDQPSSQASNELLGDSARCSLPSSLTSNPYQKKKSIPTVTPHRNQHAPQKKNVLLNLDGNASTERKKQKKRKINTSHDPRFDGSVPVPQSKLRLRVPTTTLPSRGVATTRQHQQELKRAAILERQRQVAQLNQSRPPPQDQNCLLQSSASGQGQQKKSRSDLLFESLGGGTDFDLDDVVKRKSRFAHQADAEEYARARSAVTELESTESRQEKRNKKKKKERRIVKEWFCVTCNQSFRQQQPTRCVNMGHNVKRDRRINEAKSKMEQRAELSRKSAEKGGMTLGQGIDWNYAKNRFS